MHGLLKYMTRTDRVVVAVQLTPETTGFTYRKWGSVQTCKASDWIVYKRGRRLHRRARDFRAHYRQVGAGTYIKTTPVWAEVACEADSVQTKEGVTRYRAGDYLVFNEEQGGDAYAVSADKLDTRQPIRCRLLQFPNKIRESMTHWPGGRRIMAFLASQSSKALPLSVIGPISRCSYCRTQSKKSWTLKAVQSSM